ncbi:hypothetical protein NE865_05847 [Phthorimaea operculella]|nr:hypothetical protein NE865_05847 [Phthorimaea operculella]
MFESDDFDQVLSQFDFPEVPRQVDKNDEKAIENDENIQPLSHPESYTASAEKVVVKSPQIDSASKQDTLCNGLPFKSPAKADNVNIIKETFVSPKHTKRKIINSHFDHKIKRKFPGPAGLLTGTLEEAKDETICHMELLSQDIEFSQNSLRGDLFESPLWLRLHEDLKEWGLHNIDDIRSIKQQAGTGHLRRRKAQTVTAVIETVDRSATDPLIIIRDSTGHIKCTLHRDAWSAFSKYVVSEFCAFILWKPTVLTTGGAFKKHYLNITLSNIYAVYSTTVLSEEERQPPNGYVILTDDDCTVIKVEAAPQDLGSNLNGSSNGFNEGRTEENLLDDLESIFSDDVF